MQKRTLATAVTTNNADKLPTIYPQVHPLELNAATLQLSIVLIGPLPVEIAIDYRYGLTRWYRAALNVLVLHVVSLKEGLHVPNGDLGVVEDGEALEEHEEVQVGQDVANREDRHRVQSLPQTNYHQNGSQTHKTKTD
jgi:hypothetical protein